MQIGLIGLKNSGKTTLFRTLIGSDSSSEANRTVVKVPDIRLDELTAMFNPKKKVNATLEALDIAGLQLSDDGKMKITSDFLNRVKNNDALLHVVRNFIDDVYPHPNETVDPIRDIEFLETEFLLGDMAMVEGRIEKLEKEVLKSKNEKAVRELELFKKFSIFLETERPLREMVIDENDLKVISGYQFLTMKPMIIGINFSEDLKDKVEATLAEVRNRLASYNLTVIPFFAKFESELAQLSEEEAEMFMADMGITDSALDRILRTAYRALGLHSFFTVGEDECRAWTIKKKYTAQDSAGVIHSDFYNKFIRAEVTHYEDYVKHGSFAKCKDAGVWRLEGKEYIVKDGDILNIRHG